MSETCVGLALLPVVDPSHSFQETGGCRSCLWRTFLWYFHWLSTVDDTSIQLFSGLKGGLTGGLLKESRCSCVTDDQMPAKGMKPETVLHSQS